MKIDEDELLQEMKSRRRHESCKKDVNHWIPGDLVMLWPHQEMNKSISCHNNLHVLCMWSLSGFSGSIIITGQTPLRLYKLLLSAFGVTMYTSRDRPSSS
jgi:hypothetical protein